MKKFLSVAIVSVVLSGCASTSSDVAKNCPKNLSEFDMLKSETEVVTCLGEGGHQTSKPDGRHTRMYKFGDDISTVFLFEKNGDIIRHRSYQG